MTDSTTTPTSRASEPAPLETELREPDAIVDAWPAAAPARLTGWLERNGFTPTLTALLVFVLAFLLFQLVVAPIVIGIGVAIDLVRSGEQAPDMAAVMERLTTDGQLLLTANTVGQFLGFGLLAVLVARLHSPDWKPYLRIRKPDVPGLGLAALGWAALYPAVIWTGQLNERVPLPDWLRALEEAQVDMLEGLLLGGDLSTGFLFFALALTPAICEELLFRGYLQRQTERTFGAVASIVVIGVLFGAYHLRLSQVVPLSLLGIYMGYVVWATGSLWSGFLVHLLNNGFAVAASAVAQTSPDFDTAAIEDLAVPWYVGLLGLAGAAVVSRALLARRQSVVGTTPDARPVTAPLDSPPLSPQISS